VRYDPNPSDALAPHATRLAVGIDLVEIRRVRESLDTFGDRFTRRIFTEGEIAYALSAPALAAERFAARFAAKEALKKALRCEGVGFRDIEVARAPSGACDLVLRNGVGAGVESVAVSLSHDGDYATAVVVAHIRTGNDVPSPPTGPT